MKKPFIALNKGTEKVILMIVTAAIKETHPAVAKKTEAIPSKGSDDLNQLRLVKYKGSLKCKAGRNHQDRLLSSSDSRLQDRRRLLIKVQGLDSHRPPRRFKENLLPTVTRAVDVK